MKIKNTMINKKIYTPKNKEELKNLVDNLEISLSQIDTSLITDMSKLFYKSKRKDFKGIENWDVSNVINMYAMFKHSKFNRNISKWNVSKVKYMDYMFEDTPFNKDISDWDVSRVESIYGMFLDSKVKKIITKWELKSLHVLKFFDSIMWKDKDYSTIFKYLTK